MFSGLFHAFYQSEIHTNSVENGDCGFKSTKMEEEKRGENYRLVNATAVTIAADLKLSG